MMNKEYDTIVKKIKDKCKFDFLEKSRNRKHVEARSVLYKLMEMRGVITQASSDLILERDGVFFDRVTIRHSLANFDIYYDSSNFVRDLYHSLDGYSNLERTKTKLEIYLSEVDIDRHSELLELIKPTVNSWKQAIEQDEKYFFNQK